MKSMRKWFLNDISLKAISLVLAVILWFSVSGVLTARHKIRRKEIHNVKVGLLRPSKEVVLGLFEVKVQPQEVNLLIEGPKDYLENISSKDIISFVDISDFTKEGIYRLPVKVILPDKIKTVSEVPICTVELSRYKIEVE